MEQNSEIRIRSINIKLIDFNKGIKVIQQGKEHFFQQIVLEQLYIHMRQEKKEEKERKRKRKGEREGKREGRKEERKRNLISSLQL